MRIGIRTKTVMLLVFVAALPLAASLVGIVVGGRALRTQTIGNTILALARQDAQVLSVSLEKDVEELDVTMHEAPVLEALASSEHRLSPEQLQALDQAWPTMPLDAQPMRQVLEHPIAHTLRVLMQHDLRLLELMVTDRYGQLVAASGRTADFYQGDESWWQQTYDAGRGSIVIPPVNLDPSTHRWSLDICIPIIHDGKVIGVAREEFEFSKWFAKVDTEISPGLKATAVLLDEDGSIVWSSLGTEPYTQRRERPPEHQSGFRIVGDEIEASMPVILPATLPAQNVSVNMPKWTLMLYMPKRQAMADIDRLSLQSLLAGLFVVALIFMGGWILADRNLLARISRIAVAAREVSKGDLTARVRTAAPGKMLGPDQLDTLADDFNQMIARVEQGHGALREADEMKTNFIRVASHELRTPVSYIIGMSKLLGGSTEVERLSRALQSMGEKAGRLNEIVQGMFKLMTVGGSEFAMKYETLNLADVLDDVRKDCMPFADQRRQRLIVDVPPGMTPIQADRDKVHDMVENLVMNAIKFTPDNGAVKMRVGIQLGGLATISVQDQGSGISASDLPHLFEPFFSGSDVLHHSSGQAGYQKRGLGLGLAIVRHFAHLHGGTVHLTTSPTGSTFTVTLPLSPPIEPSKEQYTI